ncbi:armadillo repeat-containing protein 3-like isoform X3 [Hippocampus zosterae]|uniref:armadillo repeat-containing protein 3-like isoform X3 n=1 Tax=Hippocampus zosterae TaxID=109293 RepID=UPI00223E5A7C|nr:armadillo repeat-containing protein 3-like isoform X3 [Hippocampus zosterae]
MDKKDKKEKKSKSSSPCKDTVRTFLHLFSPSLNALPHNPRPSLFLQFEPLRVDVKTTTTAVLLLSSPEEDIVVIACEAIFQFAGEDGNKVHLMELGVLQPLSRLIAHSNELIRRNAFMVLGTMASNSAVANALQQIDIIPTIIDKLSLDDLVIQEYGALCLSYLSLAPACKVQIFDNKGLSALIKLLASTEPDIQKNSLETIYNLVQSSQFCPSVLELGGIPFILELLHSDYVVIQHLALNILQKVTADKESYGAMRKEQGLEKLLDIIKNTDFNDLHVEALQVLVNCMSDSDNFLLIENEGGLTILFELALPPKLSEPGKHEMPLVKSSNNEVQSGAVECLSRAAQNANNHKILHDIEMEDILVELLSGSSDCVNMFVCQAMAGMSSFLSSKERFREIGGLSALIHLLSSGHALVRGEAIQALANLTSDHHQNSMTIYEEGGQKPLVQCLHDSCPRTVANAAAILYRIAGQEAVRSDLLSLGAIRALVEPLKSTDPQVVVHAALCICELASEADARTQLQSAGGLEPLVSLLRSTNMEVLRTACMAISVCAKDEPVSVEMCKFGALEMLNEINQADTSRSKFSEFAFNSLLQSSLSLKYGLTDHLASTDLITDGFYDAGKLYFGQKVLTLVELSMEPVNEHLPVIVVNSAIEVYIHAKSAQGGQQTERYWKLMNDVALRFLVKEVKESISLLNGEQERYVALARRVSKVMGGAIEKEDLHTFGWLLHISLLKVKLQCNVLPIGLISKGFYCHRALLFKYLADCIGLSCTLVRGDYNRAWNEVLLHDGDRSGNQASSQPSRYIVDLMHQPGTFFKSHTPAAFRYHGTIEHRSF